ncbi:hypothetical protein [Eubacterium barkeri]|uniref:Phage protein n=1 Tax=Eubacterium barkeri TaxID=1528 RepID=A0A1H3IN36_EUBBA|nr:hypothetical protein [Eubacterium barkeri]SDY29102.1 hypothetical protein SAMN04488579_12414 [Eubacterium barkeri]
MADVKVKINSAGARQLLNSAAVQGELLKRAEKIKVRADGMGSGKYVADVQPGKNRAHAMVKTTDFISKKSNAKHNTLLKSINAGK